MLQFLIPAALSAVGGLIGGNAAKKAAKAEAQARAMANQKLSDQYAADRPLFDPFINEGTNALRAYSDSTGANGQAGIDRSLGAYFQSPDYLQAIKSGAQAIDASAAARGGLFSGGTGKALSNYGQETGTRFIGNYRSALGNLMNVGQNAVSGAANLGQNFATNYGDNLTAAGKARAQGILGRSEAFQGALSNIGTLAGRYDPFGSSSIGVKNKF